MLLCKRFCVEDKRKKKLRAQFTSRLSAKPHPSLLDKAPLRVCWLNAECFL